MSTFAPRILIELDPNSLARDGSGQHVAMMADASRTPHAGESVTLVQPDDDGDDFVGVGRVVRLDEARGLIYISVDWASFYVEGSKFESNEPEEAAREGVHWTLRARRARPANGVDAAARNTALRVQA